MKVTVMSSNVWGNCPDDRPIADRDDKMATVYLKYLPDSIGLRECSLMLRYENHKILTMLFGQGKGSGAALVLFLLGIAGILLCVFTRGKMKQYQYTE